MIKKTFFCKKGKINTVLFAAMAKSTVFGALKLQCFLAEKLFTL